MTKIQQHQLFTFLTRECDIAKLLNMSSSENNRNNIVIFCYIGPSYIKIQKRRKTINEGEIKK